MDEELTTTTVEPDVSEYIEENNELYQEPQAEPQVNAFTQAREASEQRDQQVQKQQEEAAKPKPEKPKTEPQNAAQEAGNAVVGGVLKTANSVLTLPERFIDGVTGESAKEGYKPDWNPFDPDPFITNTWWGNLIKGGVDGTLRLAMMKKINAKTGKLFLGNDKKSQLARNAIEGGAAALISTDTAGDNLSGAAEKEILKRIPELEPALWLANPLATRDTDHPLLKWFKHAAEDMGLGLIIDNIFIRSGPKANGVQKALDRGENVKKSTLEKGKVELQEPGFGAHKNKPIAARNQGNANSTAPLDQIAKQLDEVDRIGKGATDAALTPTQRQRMASFADVSGKELKSIATQYFGDDFWKRISKEAKVKRTTVAKLYGNQMKRFTEFVGGRNMEEISPQELQKYFDKQSYLDPNVDTKILPIGEALTAELIASSAIKQAQAIALGAREMFGYDDILSKGAAVEKLRELATISITQARRTRAVAGGNLAMFRDPSISPATKKQALQELQDEAKEAVDAVFNLAGQNGNDKFLDAVLEAFTGSKYMRNMEDFGNWARTKLRGGELNGKVNEAALVKELGGVMVHSILSGPKTPIRALQGTATAVATRQISQALGASIMWGFNGDAQTAKASLASLNAMFQSIPEAWTVFRSRLDGYWSGDIATANTRYSSYTKEDQRWELLGEWVRREGNTGDKINYRFADVARRMNDSNFLTYTTKLMAATDDAFRLITARMRGRELALRRALEKSPDGAVDFKQLKEAEDDFLKLLTDDDGYIDVKKDLFLKSVFEEATLTAELTGRVARLEQAANAMPWIRPFVLFGRTGINGLALTAKNTPLLNLVLEKQRAILMGSADNLGALQKYGIYTAADLANEKALMLGRQAIGTAVVGMAVTKFLAGDLTGNGPTNRQERALWKDAGVKLNTIRFGDVEIGYQSIEPFNTILDLVADIGYASIDMGEDWTLENLNKLVSVVSEVATSKSYIAGLGEFVNFIQGEDYSGQRIFGNLINNTVPLGGLRKEIGGIITPYTRELSKSWTDAVRNRNLATEQLAAEPLPIKYNLLKFEPLKDWNFVTRAFNAFSPVPINITDDSPGLKLLRASRYDTRMSVLSAPGGIDLSNDSYVRSLFQKEISRQNLINDLDRYAEDPRVKASVDTMWSNYGSGKTDIDDQSYHHNKKINNLFKRAREKAWARVKAMNDPKVNALLAEQKESRALNAQTKYQTDQTGLLQIYK